MSEEDNIVPFEADVHPEYFNFNLPPTQNLTAESMMEWMEWQLSLVPEPYRSNTDLWGIYDLDQYNDLVSIYIHMKAQEKDNGKSIHSEDRPFITREIKKSLR